MPETFSNNATGNLNANILIGATSLVLQAGQGAAFPATGNFRILIGTELILVGARSGDTLSSLTRGIESTSAAAHSLGDLVTHELTAGALQAVQTVSSYATTLPGSPYDGQEAVLVDSTTASTYQWYFRYNTGSASGFKWEFVGGSPALSEVATAETTASTTYVDLATVGPTITVPRAGDYEVMLGALITNSGAAHNWAALKRGTAAAADGDAVLIWTPINGAFETGSRLIKVTGLAASDVLKLQYRVSATTGTFQARWLSIRPIRVS